MRRIHIIDDNGNPVNGTIEALGHVAPDDTIIVKFPVDTIYMDDLRQIYNTLVDYYPECNVIMMTNDYDILSPKSREEYKAFLKDELAKLEEENGTGRE